MPPRPACTNGCCTSEPLVISVSGTRPANPNSCMSLPINSTTSGKSSALVGSPSPESARSRSSRDPSGAFFASQAPSILGSRNARSSISSRSMSILGALPATSPGTWQ